MGCGQSFTASTKVLTASGKPVAISTLKAGDKVIATDTKTGKTSAQTVTAVLVNHDTDLYDLKVKTAEGTAIIHTTRSHLFYDLSQHRWVTTSHLRRGDRLGAPSGRTRVTAVGGYTPANHDGWMWDLSVPGGNDHNFYIDTIAAPILVHSCDIGHADIHQFPGIRAGKSQFFDDVDSVRYERRERNSSEKWEYEIRTSRAK